MRDPLSSSRLAPRGARRSTARVAVFAVLAGTAVLLIAFLVARHVTGPNTSPATPRRQMISSPPHVVLPSIAQVRQARVLARQRSGDVSFAVVDTSGKPHCYRCNERYVAASVVKAMLLIGYLEQLAEDDRPLSSSHRAFLSAMIRRSDNASADAIYLHVGDPGLYRIAAGREWRDSTSTATGQRRESRPPTRRGYSRASTLSRRRSFEVIRVGSSHRLFPRRLGASPRCRGLGG
jgi:hypothetical protein